MSIKIENTPSPSVLMNSMRSIGYTFKTALADIVDNSISASAKNVWIDVPVNDNDLYITILDDGNGMSRGDLFNAMKYGSDRDYARENHMGNTKFYVDDGYTGTNFNRPGFQELLDDIEMGYVGTIIVKDYCAIIGLNQKDLENQGILA